MTQTESPAGVPVEMTQWARRAGARDAARVIVFGEAALLFIIAILYTANGGNVLQDLWFLGAGVLVWGAARMGRDAPRPLPRAGDVDSWRQVPWDWSDMLMFVPGAFTAASVLVSLALPLTDAVTGGGDAAVRTAAESAVQQAAFYAGALFNVWVLVGLRRGGSLFALGWRRFSWWWIPIAVVAAFATLEIAGILQVLSQRLFPSATNTQCQAVQHDYSHFIALAIIVVCFIAPLAEETVFRGFLYGWLYRVMPVGFALVISGAIFSLAHGVVLLFLPLWAVGIILAVVFQTSRSLWPGAIVHALFNLPGIISILTTPTC